MCRRRRGAWVPAAADAAAVWALRRLPLVLLLAAVTAPAPAASARQPPAPREVYYRYSFPQGVYLDQIPGAAKLNPGSLVGSLGVTLAPVIYEGPTNGRKLFKFTGMGYVDDSTGLTNMFAPTMRLKRGMPYLMRITNALVQAKVYSGTNWFNNPGDTNKHTHGIHAPTGVPNQATGQDYGYGDNVFNTIPARNSTREEPASVLFNMRLSSNHMPGLHWYHAHQHGSTTLQVGTAHGMIVIEDDNDQWLPQDKTNCTAFRRVIEEAEDVLLDIELFFFRKGFPNIRIPNEVNFRGANYTLDRKAKEYSQYIDQADNGAYQFYAQESFYPDQYGVKRNKASGRATTGDRARGLNVLTVNGAYQPIVRMPEGVWQRWRILFSGIKGFFVLNVYDKATNQPTSACVMMLYAKDGVYLQDLPRLIPAIFLAAANRAEVLIRCSGPAGTRYIVTSQSSEPFSANNFEAQPNSPFGRNNNFGPIQQDVVWEIEVTTPPPYPLGSPLTSIIPERQCVPLRPGYAVDLRDDALAAANVSVADKLVTLSVGFGLLTPNNTPLGNSSAFYSFACGYAPAPGQPGQRYVFPDPAPLVLELGKVVQWNLFGIKFHPIHTHINPYQIAFLNQSWLSPGGSYANYFEAGDWHDSLTLPMTQLFAQVPVRFLPGQYQGYTVSHCHYLMHEDVGCMKVLYFKCPTQADDAQGPDPCPGFEWVVPPTASEQ